VDTKTNKITNPHDKLFRETWSDPANVRSFLQHYLPAEVLKITNFETLEICKDSFVGKDLREYFSDMLYKLDLSDCPGYIYVLFEHKSYHEKFIHLQLLEYMLKIWRLALKQDKKAGLPVVIPLVLCHGRSNWPTNRTRLSSLLAGPTDLLADYIPDFSFVLYDLTRFSDDEIKGTIMTRVVMLMFKYIFDPDVAEKLPGIFSLMRELMEKETGLQHLETVLRYLFSTVETISTDKIKTIVEQSLSDKEGNFIMTLAEQLHKEGFEKGMQQGVQQGMQQGIREGLMEGIEIAISFKYPDEVYQIMPMIYKINDTKQLKMVKDVIITARRASEIIIFLKKMG
jgi:predicted transposase/invertase (TIGR01784 family)